MEINLTETELKALEYIANDPQDFIENFAKVRANEAMDEILKNLVSHCNENGIALAVGKEAQVAQAFELSIAKTAADREAEFLASLPE
ncbi:MAG: hypothetical protein CBB72_011375 [Muricauda sp. TMED12]|nr:MAG: hypothetical protein CBB72_011375 [Muricauda sp. TMED12]